jgi:hypothetical protein
MMHRPRLSPVQASEGIRTPDPLITNQPLYRLSYAGVFPLSAATLPDSVLPGKMKKGMKKKKNLLSSSRNCSFFR